LLRNKQDAEDAVQETFLRIAEAEKANGDHGVTAGYARRVVGNVIVDAWRRRARLDLGLDEGDLLASCLDSNADSASLVESRDQLRWLASRLPKNTFQIVRMRFAGGKTIPEIAHACETSESSVKRVLRKILTRFARLNR